MVFAFFVIELLSNRLTLVEDTDDVLLLIGSLIDMFFFIGFLLSITFVRFMRIPVF